MTPVGKKTKIELSVSSGSLKLARFTLEGGESKDFKAVRIVEAGKTVGFTV
jgi:hypothetical protein